MCSVNNKEKIYARKAELRKQIIDRLKQVKQQEIQQWSSAINRQVLSFVEQEKPKRIMFFMPIKQEPRIEPALNYLYEAGKQILLPCIRDGDIVPGIYEGESSLVKGRFGILEPQRICDEDCIDIDIVFMPFVAFDDECRRLGRGKGYYDRFLTRLGEKHIGWRIGLGFEIQRVPQVPFTARDVKLDKIVTEEKIYEC